MQERSDITLILGRHRPSKRLTSAQVLCQFAAMCLQASMCGGERKEMLIYLRVNRDLEYNNGDTRE